MNYSLDLTDSVVIDLTIEKDKTLEKTFKCEIYSGDTFTGYFDFSPYTGSTLTVKGRSNDFVNTVVFSTADNSIALNSNGEFTLYKTASQTAIRTGKYVYEMTLSSSAETRGFLRGKFSVIDESYGAIVNDNVSNQLIRIAVKDNIAVTGSTGSANIYASNGLTKSGDTIVLGGALTGHTTLTGNNEFDLNLGILESPFSSIVVNAETGYITTVDLNLVAEEQIELSADAVNVVAQDSINLSGNLNVDGGNFYYDEELNVVGLIEGQIKVGVDPGNIAALGTSTLTFTDDNGSRYAELHYSNGTLNVIGTEGINFSSPLTEIGGTNLSLTAGNAINMFSSDAINVDAKSIDIGTYNGDIILESSNQILVTANSGMTYSADYSANFGPRSIPDAAFVTGNSIATNGLSKVGNTILLGGALTGDTVINTTGGTAMLTLGGNGRIIFAPTNNISGLNVGANANTPSLVTNGDIWYNSSTGSLDARINSLAVSVTHITQGNIGPNRVVYTNGNSSGRLGAASEFTFNPTTSLLSVPNIATSGTVSIGSFTVGTLPSANPAGRMIYVSNESGGAVPAFSDGTNWRRMTDRNIVS